MKIIIRVMDRISHHFLSDWTHPKRKPVVYVKWPLYFKLEKKEAFARFVLWSNGFYLKLLKREFFFLIQGFNRRQADEK